MRPLETTFTFNGRQLPGEPANHGSCEVALHQGLGQQAFRVVNYLEFACFHNPTMQCRPQKARFRFSPLLSMMQSPEDMVHEANPPNSVVQAAEAWSVPPLGSSQDSRPKFDGTDLVVSIDQYDADELNLVVGLL